MSNRFGEMGQGREETRLRIQNGAARRGGEKLAATQYAETELKLKLSKDFVPKDWATDGQVRGHVVRIGEKGDVVLRIGTKERVYHPQFLTNLTRPKKLE